MYSDETKGFRIQIYVRARRRRRVYFYVSLNSLTLAGMRHSLNRRISANTSTYYCDTMSNRTCTPLVRLLRSTSKFYFVHLPGFGFPSPTANCRELFIKHTIIVLLYKQSHI